MSATLEVLAWNDLAAALMEDFGQLPPHERNLARRAFLGSNPEIPLYGITDSAQFRCGVVTALRAAAARYPSDLAVTGHVTELREGSGDFTRLWERHDVQVVPAMTKTFLHPVVGEITLDCDTLALSDCDQHLVLYSAAPGSRDAEALALLDVLGTDTSPRMVMESVLRPYDLGPTQWYVLYQLATAGATAQRALVALLQVERATLSGVVAALVRKGLVVQETDATDQRQKVLSLTAAGAALWRELPVPIAIILDTAFRGVPKRDLDTTTRVLRAATGKLGDLLAKGAQS